MFDDLIRDTEFKGYRVIRRAIRPHHVALTGVIMVTAGLLSFLFVFGYLHSTIKSSVAREGRVIIQSVDPEADESMVAPIRLYPLTTLSVSVEHVPVAFKELRFLLNGLYELSELQGVTLVINDVQVGPEQYPDEFGMVRFSFDTVTLKPGTHTVLVRLSTTDAADVALNAVFDAGSSFTFTDPSDGLDIPWTMRLPHASRFVRTVTRGSLGLFTKAFGDSKGSSFIKLYGYAEAEDLLVKQIRFAASDIAENVRLDVFLGTTFIASASFEGSEAVLSLSPTPLTILRENNTVLTILFAGDGAASLNNRHILLTEADVEGLTSGQRWTEEFSVDVY